jgi:hypothetical protein
LDDPVLRVALWKIFGKYTECVVEAFKAVQPVTASPLTFEDGSHSVRHFERNINVLVAVEQKRGRTRWRYEAFHTVSRQNLRAGGGFEADHFSRPEAILATVHIKIVSCGGWAF